MQFGPLQASRQLQSQVYFASALRRAEATVVVGKHCGDIPASPAVLMFAIVTAIGGGGQWEGNLPRRPERVLSFRVVGDRPPHIIGSGNGTIFLKRRDHAAPNCVIDASGPRVWRPSKPVAAHTIVIDVLARVIDLRERVRITGRGCVEHTAVRCSLRRRRLLCGG